MSYRDNDAPDTTRNVSDNTRPVTSKPRGVCKYYNTSRGCYAGDRCKFLHGQSERLTPFDKSKACKFYAAGWCRHGDKCWFIHADPLKQNLSTPEPSQDSEEEDLCSICYDKPVTYGLLIGCSHVFCLPCIKNWRGSEGKSTDILEAGTTKTCPMCRTTSRFVIPSSLFFADGDPKKAEVIEKYKNSMARIKCRYFERSKRRRFCPFGRDCFYKHENEDGTPYVFPHGVEYYMGQRHTRDDSGLELDRESVEAMLRIFIDNASSSSRAMRRAVLSSIAAVFGTDNLPPMYTLDDESGQEEEAATPAPADADQAETQPAEEGAVWGDWPANDALDGLFPLAENDTYRAPSALFSHSLAAPESPQLSSGTTLDPTSPAFVPSYLLDNMRTLPPGPSGLHTQAEDHTGISGVDNSASSREEHLWDVEGLVRDWEERQRHHEMSSATTSMTVIPAAESSTDVAQAALSVQDTDPPFMTDGRGRVVWSSTTATRGREGRRGRATSSSATIVPHTKSTSDLSATEESSDEVSHRDRDPVAGERSASSSRLVRQRSLPLVTDGGRPAEFVTDGRGRVVFASSSQ